MEKNNIMQEESSKLVISGYAYCSKLKGIGMQHFASQLLKEMIESSMEAGFTSSALSPREFGEHLNAGYYASGKVVYYLEIISSICGKDEPIEGHKDLYEAADKIHRMYAASIKTYRKKLERLEAAQVTT